VHLRKRFVFRCHALYWLIRSRGRIRGEAFRIRKPNMVRLGRHGRVRLGRHALVDHGARIVVHGDCAIGSGVYIGRDLVLSVYEDVTIGDRVLLGERVSVHSANHGPPGRRSELEVAPVHIEDDVWLCAGVVVTPGASVGARSTVGANSVVTKAIPQDALAVGSPARPVQPSGERDPVDHVVAGPGDRIDHHQQDPARRAQAT
jgi:acetyltransferase-like isoleucine patch superfamily enzyme